MLEEKKDYKELINGKIPPWVRRFIKLVGKGINKYEMIRDDETILLGVSGGKDSLALALALSLRKKWLPINYELKPFLINWVEHSLDDEQLLALKTYFKDLGMDLLIVNEDQFNQGFKNEFNCYLCSRNRRRILFDYARSQNIKKIALGHHLDDIVETSLMNLFFRGTFSSMNPVQDFFDGEIKVIRPMNLVHEQSITRLCECYNIPVAKPVCPYDQINIRSQIKPIIKQISHMDKYAREHIYNAHNFDELLNK